MCMCNDVYTTPEEGDSILAHRQSVLLLNARPVASRRLHSSFGTVALRSTSTPEHIFKRALRLWGKEFNNTGRKSSCCKNEHRKGLIHVCGHVDHHRFSNCLNSPQGVEASEQSCDPSARLRRARKAAMASAVSGAAAASVLIWITSDAQLGYKTVTNYRTNFGVVLPVLPCDNSLIHTKCFEHRCHGSFVCHTSASCNQHRSRKSLQACTLPAAASTALDGWLWMVVQLSCAWPPGFADEKSKLIIQGCACNLKQQPASCMLAVMSSCRCISCTSFWYLCFVAHSPSCCVRCLSNVFIREHPYIYLVWHHIHCQLTADSSVCTSL